MYIEAPVTFYLVRLTDAGRDIVVFFLCISWLGVQWQARTDYPARRGPIIQLGITTQWCRKPSNKGRSSGRLHGDMVIVAAGSSRVASIAVFGK